MAFPFVYESNFENGTTPFGWDTETDTGSQLDVAHYSELARSPHNQSAPYKGAYALRCVLAGGTADAFLEEGDLNIAAAGTAHAAFNVWFSPDFDATADDTVHLFELQGAADAIQAVVGFRYVAATDVINIGMGELAPTSFSGIEIKKGVWYTVELAVTLDDGVSDDGTLDIYITEEGSPAATVVSATQVASLDQVAVTHGVIGVQNHLATTTGTILIDRFVFDDARIYPATDRFKTTKTLTQSGHVFVGPGKVLNATLLSGAGTDNVLKIFDTDVADTNDFSNVALELKNTANNETVDPAGVPVDIIRGCYAQLTGTNPRAKIEFCTALNSVANIRRYGLRRKV